jgi:hypothetical protein
MFIYCYLFYQMDYLFFFIFLFYITGSMQTYSFKIINLQEVLESLVFSNNAHLFWRKIFILDKSAISIFPPFIGSLLVLTEAKGIGRYMQTQSCLFIFPYMRLNWMEFFYMIIRIKSLLIFQRIIPKKR